MTESAPAAVVASRLLTADQRAVVLYDALTDRKLELTLFPTEHCNFRCTYCYEDFSIGRMSRSTISGIKALIAARAPTLDRLLISWFGGEPLVAFDIVEEISAAASSMAGQHGFTTDIGITTNGYALTASKAQRLFAAGVTSYQISLDGEEQEHNTTRRRADGAGTFSTIWRNLETLQKLAEDGSIAGTRVMLRLHVHPGNVVSIRRLIDRIKSKLSPNTFSILIKEVGKYGGKNDSALHVFEGGEQRYANLKRELYELVAGYERPLHDGEVYVCYAAKANAFTIRANGSVGKCTVALNSDRNAIGRITEEGRLELDGPKAGLWLHPLQSMSLDDLGCPVARLPHMAV